MLCCWCYIMIICFFFFKQKTAYEMRISDWSSDVCSSDLPFDDLVEDEGGGGDQQAEAEVGRTWAAHAAVNTVSQRLHKLPSASTSGRWRQQRPHLWFSVRVTASSPPARATATMKISSSAAGSSVGSGIVTSASRLERIVFSRR